MTIFIKDYEIALEAIVPSLLEQIDESEDKRIYISLRGFREELMVINPKFENRTFYTLYTTIKPILLKHGIFAHTFDGNCVHMRMATEEEKYGIESKIGFKRSSCSNEGSQVSKHYSENRKCDNIRKAVVELKKDPQSLFNNAEFVKKIRKIEK